MLLATDYVGGSFYDHKAKADVLCIARWDGAWWHRLGSRLGSMVRAIEVVGSELYVGGQFNDAGDVDEADSIARWGTAMHAVFLPAILRS